MLAVTEIANEIGLDTAKTEVIETGLMIATLGLGAHTDSAAAVADMQAESEVEEVRHYCARTAAVLDCFQAEARIEADYCHMES